jgi:6-phospho-3-hexuloisomerase
MSSIKDLARIVSKEIENCLGSVSDEAFQKGLREIEAADQIFVAGAGRSGLAIRGLAMRLMHAEKKCMWSET